MGNKKLACRLIAFLILLTLIINWRTALLMTPKAILHSEMALLISLFAALFFLLNGIAAIGLYLIKRWGFWLTYIAMIFTTIFFSVSYIPAPRMTPYLFAIINCLLFIVIIYLHISTRKKTKV